MMTRTILTVALASFSLTGAAQADTYSHIEDLAHRLDRYATQLDREFTLHYRHTPQYRHLHEDAYEMAELARHVHEVAHAHGSASHLAGDLRKLDRLFHHTEDLVREIEHDAVHDDHDPFGHFSNRFRHRHGGHIHGDTRHVRRLLKAMEDTLHHLRDDVEALVRAPHRHPRFDRPESPFGRPGPVIRFSRPGFSIWLGR